MNKELEKLTDKEIIEKRNNINNPLQSASFNRTRITDEQLESLLTLDENFYGILQNNYDEVLYYYDSGNDFRTDFTVSTKNKRLYTISSDNLEYKLYELYPLTKTEIEEEKIRKERAYKKRSLELLKVTEKTQDKFRFGKYKGHLVMDIFETDINYINWCMENIKGFPVFISKIQDKMK